MPMAQAVRLCPSAIVVRHHFERYREASDRFFDILGRFSPLVESLSLDEAFVDVTESASLFGDGPTIAARIKKEVRSELDLVASVGVAPTKFVAKIASDIDKPDGLRVVEADALLAFLHPLPISRLWGVGSVTRERLRRLGLETIGDVARYPEDVLRRRLGDNLGAHLARLARGEDERDVVAGHAPVSIGHEETFDEDRTSRDELRPRLLDQADRVASRLRRAGLRASVVVVKLKYHDFRQLTRRRTLADPTSDGRIIGDTALALLEGLSVSPREHRVRLCGVAVAGLESRSAPRQLSLYENQRARGERLGDALDAIEDRFGKGIIRRGSSED